jgi:hypothetical protein
MLILKLLLVWYAYKELEERENYYQYSGTENEEIQYFIQP